MARCPTNTATRATQGSILNSSKWNVVYITSIGESPVIAANPAFGNTYFSLDIRYIGRPRRLTKFLRLKISYVGTR